MWRQKRVKSKAALVQEKFLDISFWSQFRLGKQHPWAREEWRCCPQTLGNCQWVRLSSLLHPAPQWVCMEVHTVWNGVIVGEPSKLETTETALLVLLKKITASFLGCFPLYEWSARSAKDPESWLCHSHGSSRRSWAAAACLDCWITGSMSRPRAPAQAWNAFNGRGGCLVFHFFPPPVDTKDQKLVNGR